jgi:hypothetical protein
VLVIKIYGRGKQTRYDKSRIILLVKTSWDIVESEESGDDEDFEFGRPGHASKHGKGQKETPSEEI